MYSCMCAQLGHVNSTILSGLACEHKAALFLFEFTSPCTYDPGFRLFVKQMFKTGKEKQNQNVLSSFFPAKMGLNSSEPSTRTAHALPCLHTQ